MTRRVVLLTPSQGAGGGIERYAETLEWAFRCHGITCRRVNLPRPGMSAHAQLLTQARSVFRRGEASRLVVLHRRLLPVACMLARDRAVAGVSLVCHGGEVWGARPRGRRLIERQLMRRSDVRVVAASSFTAGILASDSPAAILPPGLSEEWFHALVAASDTGSRNGSGITLVTAFRLPDWRRKGLPELLKAVTSLGRPDVRLIVCGSGQPTPELLSLVGDHACCTMLAGLSDDELAVQLAMADLFVLATRTRMGRRPAGEGFGLVLLEAQVAGTAVVGPAYGGSHAAFVDGVTGMAPADESAAALTVLLDSLVGDPARLALMGKRAAEWSRERFAPDRYALQAIAKLL